MQFFSTRDHNRVVSSSQAIAQGLSDEGGLFVPQSFPQVDVKAICALDYPEMAAAIVGQYLTDYSQEFLQEAAKATYGTVARPDLRLQGLRPAADAEAAGGGKEKS